MVMIIILCLGLTLWYLCKAVVFACKGEIKQAGIELLVTSMWLIAATLGGMSLSSSLN